MNPFILYLLVVVGLFALELIYFKLADRFNIIDKPNERSSHTSLTIRGGGIVFLFAALIYFFSSDFTYPYFFAGLLCISLVSFIDDIYSLSSRVRLPIHILSMVLMLYQVIGSDSIGIMIIGVILATGILNAYNFMDGINGITGIYSVVALSTLITINYYIPFIDSEYLYFTFLGVMVFNFYNFRRKARCFAGDVGSVSIAIIILFALFLLIYKTQNLWYLLLLVVYGVDSILTIMHRLMKNENITQAHRSHLYQWLVKPGPFTHLQIAGVYSVLQLIINVLVFYFREAAVHIQWTIAVCIISILSIIYVFLKRFYIQKYNLV